MTEQTSEDLRRWTSLTTRELHDRIWSNDNIAKDASTPASIREAANKELVGLRAALNKRYESSFGF